MREVKKLKEDLNYGFYTADAQIICDNIIYGWEPYFEKMTQIARINHVDRGINFCHGYFPPHYHGLMVKKYAERIGYSFNEK